MIDGKYEADDLAVYEYVECGALGHTWDFVGGIGRRKRPPPFGTLVVLRCMRCDMERHDVIQRESRELLSRNYWPPENWKFVTGGRPKRIDFMLMSIDEKRRKRIKRDTTITHTVAKWAPRKEVTP